MCYSVCVVCEVYTFIAFSLLYCLCCKCSLLYYSEKYVVALQQMGLPKENEKINQTFVTFTVRDCVFVCVSACPSVCVCVYVSVCTFRAVHVEIMCI